MGFLDKAKAAAMDLQTKADTALGNSGLMGGSPLSGSSGQADRLLRELGVLTYKNATGQPAPAEDYNRVMGELQKLAAAGQLHLDATTTGGPAAPPPPPGAAAAAATAPPAPGAPAAPEPATEPVVDATAPPGGLVDVPEEEIEIQHGGGTGAPPPPPSWA